MKAVKHAKDKITVKRAKSHRNECCHRLAPPRICGPYCTYFLRGIFRQMGGWHSGSALASQAPTGVPLHEVVGSNPTSSTFFFI